MTLMLTFINSESLFFYIRKIYLYLWETEKSQKKKFNSYSLLSVMYSFSLSIHSSQAPFISHMQLLTNQSLDHRDTCWIIWNFCALKLYPSLIISLIPSMYLKSIIHFMKAWFNIEGKSNLTPIYFSFSWDRRLLFILNVH